MQLKQRTAVSSPVAKTAPAQQQVMKPTGPTYVYQIDVREFTKDRGESYYANYRGVFAYLFDDPSRKNNLVLVKYGKNDAVVSMRICEYLIHLAVWRANVVFELPIDSSDFYDLSHASNKTFTNMFEKVAEKFIELEGEVTPAVCDCLVFVKEQVSKIAEGFASVRCNTVSIWDIIKFKNRNPEFKELLYTELDSTKTIKELELQMKECERRLVAVIKADGKNCFAPYLHSGRIKSAQLTKVLCAVGTRPDIDKTILPLPIPRGYIHGLPDVASYFMETITARDAMLTKSDNVPLSGFLSREINRLTSNVWVNYDIEDCGTKNYLSFKVETEDYIKMIENKYYFDPDTDELKVVNRNDKHLVGKTIKLRSFIGCASKEGVCKKCVGKIANRLRGTRLGTLPPIKAINPLSQKAMSAKHDLGTKSIEITSEALQKYFYNDGVDFFINPEYANAKGMYIVVGQDDVEEILYSSLDLEDSSVETRINLSYVAIRDHDVDYPIENEGMRVALTDETIMSKGCFTDDHENPDYVLIPLNKLDPSNPVFSIVLDTEEISKYLNAFIGTIDRVTVKRFTSYDELMCEMIKIVYESGFVNRIMHFEAILYSMIRDLANETIRPDMSIPGVQYQILKVSSAIEKKDMYTTLAFQGLRRLFKDTSIRRRMGTSLYDPFFRVGPLY